MSQDEKIIEKIIRDAEAQRDEILRVANAKAEKVIQKATAVAEKELEKALHIAQAEAEKAVFKELSGADMEAKKSLLQTKQECLEDIMKDVKTKLFALEGKDYEHVLVSMLEKAEKGEEIIFSAKDKESLGRLVTQKGYVVSEETRDINGGFIVRKGDIEYNYTFTAILAIEREEIEKMAAEILFA